MAVPMINPYTPYSPLNYSPNQMMTNPYYQAMNLQLQNQQQSSMPIMSWVQGINGAKAYPLGPNARAFLFDSEKDVFYVKTTDNSGMPQPIREFEYSEIAQEASDSNTKDVDVSNFATKDDLKEILSKLEELKGSRIERRNNNGKSSIRGANESRNGGSI